MAEALVEQGLEMDLALVSSAARAQETAELVLAGVTRQMVTRPDLYHASAGELLDVAREQPSEVESVVLVGHNPGMHMLAERLAHQGDPGSIDLIRWNFPTGAFAEFSFTSPTWSEVAPTDAVLERYLYPKGLPDAKARRL